MADTAQQLYRTGAISTSAYNKLLAQTKVQNSKMAQFDGRKKDEGGRVDAGDRTVASRTHIDTKQDIAPKPLTGNRATRKPSGGTGARTDIGKNSRSFDRTGGSVPNPGDQPRRRQIDQGSMQRPTFPRGTKIKASSLGGASNKKAKGRIPPRGGQYGGGGKGTQ